MKRSNSTGEKVPFNGTLRHYHRNGSQSQRTWDEWVDVKSAPSWISRNVRNLVCVTLALLILGGMVAGLIIELR